MTAAIALLYIIASAFIIQPPSSSTTIASADYVMFQSPFESNVNDTNEPDCHCLQNKKSKTTTKDTIIHGENAPVLVPETLPNIPTDVLEKLQNNKIDNTVLVTIAGYNMRYQVYNWIHKLNEIEETHFVIFCTDNQLYVHLVVAGYEAQVALVPEDWLVEGKDQTSHIKTWILQRIMYADDDDGLIMMVDLDAIFVRSRGMEYLTTLMNIRHETHLIAIQDSFDQHTADTGVMMVRSRSKQVKRLLANTIQIQQREPQLTQQEAFNVALSKMELHVKTGIYVILDVMHFPNGVSFFENDLSRSKGIQPYIVHANNKAGQEQIEMLKEHGLWIVDEDWVDSHNIQVDAILNRSKTIEQEDT
ncbi:glycosyltransferase family 77 protein, partial [Backusella circina FSU 941]